MTKKKLPQRIVLQESKEVIFYLENPMPSEITIPIWMKSFPDEYTEMIMTNASLFKILNDQSKKERFDSWEKFIPRLAPPQPNISCRELPSSFYCVRVSNF